MLEVKRVAERDQVYVYEGDADYAQFLQSLQCAVCGGDENEEHLLICDGEQAGREGNGKDSGTTNSSRRLLVTSACCVFVREGHAGEAAAPASQLVMHAGLTPVAHGSLT